MAFKRSRLMEILQDEEKSPAEKAEMIMDEHLSVVNPIKEERDTFREQAEKIPALQKQMEKLEEEAGKFEDERKSFEDFRKKVEQDAETEKLKTAYRKMLKEESYSDKWVERILETTNFAEMKIGEDGKLEDEKKLRDAVNEKWSDVKSTVTERGAKVEKPLETGKPVKTKAEILAITDTAERQKAIAENINLWKG